MRRQSRQHKSRPRHRPTHGTARKTARAGVPRPQLSPDDVKQLAGAMRKAYGWDGDPKDFQLEAVKAQIEGVDIIVQAPTGAGKTALAAGPHLWTGFENRFTLMVCPLLSLEEEMERTFQTDFNLKAVALNSKNGACSPDTIRKILALEYQVIIISPEMLQSRSFINRILRNTTFMRNIVSMFIDEAHCIVHWGADFRKKYGTLGKIRAFLPRGTPVIAVTATLTARVRRSIHASLHFAQSEKPSRFINKGNDRSNVSIVVRACEHPLNTYADLDFVIPNPVRAPTDIPKTYIYVDNIAVGGEIIDYLNCRITEQTAPAPDARSLPHGLIRPFNATLSQEYRSNAMARFRAGDIRVLVCTDAAGMGCNIPDIERVVQWKLPSTFSNFIQRAGRAARGRNRTGLAVLLVEKSVYCTDLVTQPAPSTSSKDTKKKKDPTSATTSKSDPKANREYARAHGVYRGGSKRLDSLPDGLQPELNPDAADEGLLSFVQSTTCRRKIWAAAFESTAGETTVPCCDICDPTLLDRTRPKTCSTEPNARNPRRGLPDLNAQDKLRDWRIRTYARDFPYAQFDETAILDDDLVRSLVSYGPLTAEQISKVLADKWLFWSKYGENLTAYVLSLNISFKPLPVKPRGVKRKKETLDCSPREPAKHPRTAERLESASSPSTSAGAWHPRDVLSASMAPAKAHGTSASPSFLSSQPSSSYSHPQPSQGQVSYMPPRSSPFPGYVTGMSPQIQPGYSMAAPSLAPPLGAFSVRPSSQASFTRAYGMSTSFSMSSPSSSGVQVIPPVRTPLPLPPPPARTPLPLPLQHYMPDRYGSFESVGYGTEPSQSDTRLPSPAVIPPSMPPHLCPSSSTSYLSPYHSSLPVHASYTTPIPTPPASYTQSPQPPHVHYRPQFLPY